MTNHPNRGKSNNLGYRVVSSNCTEKAQIMPNITVCPRCGKCYEERCEEEANSPTRSCLDCFGKLRNSNLNMLTDEFARYEAQRIQ